MKRCLTKVEPFGIPGQLGGNEHAGGVCHTDTGGTRLGQHGRESHEALSISISICGQTELLQPLRPCLNGCIMGDGRQWPAQVIAGKGLVTAWPMLDSSSLLADENWVQLQSKLQQDGYLLLRGALDRAAVQEVRPVATQEALATCCWPCLHA